MFTQLLSKVHKSSTVLMKRVSYTILHNHKHPPHPFLQPSRPTLLRENCTLCFTCAHKCTVHCALCLQVHFETQFYCVCTAPE